MKIQIEAHGMTHITETNSDNISIDVLIDIINNLLLCKGYNQQSIIYALEQFIEANKD